MAAVAKNNFDTLPKPFFVLAPMDDVTDVVFRQIVESCAAPNLYVTEFVNVDGLQSAGRHQVIKKLQKTATETTLVVQIWGKNPENFYKTAEQLVDGTILRELGLPEAAGFIGVDLNMGCPEKSVVKNGSCSALINDRPLASEIIKATQAGLAGALPLSVKTRLGFTTIDLSWHEFLLGHGLDMLTIHGRTRKEMSAVPTHWDVIGQIRELRDQLAPKTLLVGNGDVMSRVEAANLAQLYQLDGIMIGRGIFQDPYVFAAPAASGQSPWQDVLPVDRLKLYRRQVALFAATWQHDERKVFTLNKFCKIYVNGFDGAKELREQLMAATSTDDLLGLLDRTIAGSFVGNPT